MRGRAPPRTVDGMLALTRRGMTNAACQAGDGGPACNRIFVDHPSIESAKVLVTELAALLRRGSPRQCRAAAYTSPGAVRNALYEPPSGRGLFNGLYVATVCPGSGMAGWFALPEESFASYSRFGRSSGILLCWR